MIKLNTKNLNALMDWFLVPEAAAPLDIQQDRVQVAAWCLNRLFLKAPRLVLDEVKMRTFETIISEQFHQSPICEVRYECQYPKYDFLRYLVHTRRYLLHGSGHHDIEYLEPREQTDWN